MDPEILNRSLSTINREGHRLLRLVDDLLNVNQFDKIELICPTGISAATAAVSGAVS